MWEWPQHLSSPAAGGIPLFRLSILIGQSHPLSGSRLYWWFITHVLDNLQVFTFIRLLSVHSWQLLHPSGIDLNFISPDAFKFTDVFEDRRMAFCENSRSFMGLNKKECAKENKICCVNHKTSRMVAMPWNYFTTVEL